MHSNYVARPGIFQATVFERFWERQGRFIETLEIHRCAAEGTFVEDSHQHAQDTLLSWKIKPKTVTPRGSITLILLLQRNCPSSPTNPSSRFVPRLIVRSLSATMQAVRSLVARRLVGGQSRGMATRSGAREDLVCLRLFTHRFSEISSVGSLLGEFIGCGFCGFLQWLWLGEESEWVANRMFIVI